MRNLFLLSSLSLAFLLARCAKPQIKTPEKANSSDNSLDQRIALPQTGDIIRTPTNPEGGLLPGRNPELTVEDSVARQKKNIQLPIVYPQGVAGISLTTPRSEVMNTLANPAYIAADGFIVYPEFVSIDWKSESDDPTPDAFYIREGYKGPLALPAPYGTMFLGEKYPDFLSEPGSKLLALGRTLANGAQDYDCEIAGTCYYFRNDEGTHFYLFSQGGFLFTADGVLTQVRIATDNKLPKRSKDAMVYGTSIGGISLKSTRSEVEARFGPAVADADGIASYDDQSINISWDATGKPTLIQALRWHKGQLELAKKKYSPGDSFAAFSAQIDDGKLLMINLDRMLGNRAAGFDCSTATIPLCSYKVKGSYIEIKLEKQTFYVSNDATRTWAATELQM